MNPRERTLAAINLATPDRTPRDFWAEPPELARILAHTGLPDEETLLQRLEIDIRRYTAPCPPEVDEGGGIYRNMWGERYVYRATEWGPVREDKPGALADAAGLAEIEGYAWPTPDDCDYSGVAGWCARYPDHALMYGFADVWERPALVRGWEQFLIDMAEQPEWAHRLCRIFTDFYLEDYTRAQQAAGGRIDLFLLLTDLGGQGAPLISPRMFEQFVAPYMGEMIDRIHELGARVMFHSCGFVRPFIPRLIELGVDVLDPIQPVAPSMSPEALKADFGDRLCFHGGIDTQYILTRGTPEEVAAEGERYSRVLGAGGGYILCSAHLFQPDVPPENALAMYGYLPG